MNEADAKIAAPVVAKEPGIGRLLVSMCETL
jgi:hypothetical protein